MKKVSDVFKSIRFAKLDPKHDKGPATSTDDEEHGAVSSQEFAQQLAHVKKRAMQEEKKDQYDTGEYDQEGDMAKSDLRSIIANAQKMHDMLDDADNLPEWVQSKITKAEDYISTVANYMTSEMSEEVESIDEASKQKLMIGSKVTHPDHGKGTVVMHAQGGGTSGTIVKFAAGKKVKVDHKKLKMAEEFVAEGSEQQHTVTVGTKTGSTSHTMTFTGTRSQAIKKAVARFGTSKNPVVKAVRRVAEEVEQLEEGRPSQRHPLEGHEYHKKTNAELEYIAKDAHKAAEAMKGHNTTAENKYRDQANDSATVRYFRKKSGTPDWYKKKYGLKEGYEDHHLFPAYMQKILKKHEASPEEKAKNAAKAAANKAKPATPQKQEPYKPLGGRDEKSGRSYSEEVEQIDELSNDMLGRYKKAAGEDASKADKAGDHAKGNKRFSGIVKATKKQFDNDMKKEETKPPFDGPYKKATGTVTDKSGAKHTAFSQVKDLAKKAMQAQAAKMKPVKTVKESLEESRKVEIIKDASKSAKEKASKTKDKFEADPVLSSEIVKEDK